MDSDGKMNANNSEIVIPESDDSDFEIEITGGFFPDMFNIEIVPKFNVIQFREQAQCAAKHGEHKVAVCSNVSRTECVANNISFSGNPLNTTENSQSSKSHVSKDKCKTEKNRGRLEENTSHSSEHNVHINKVKPEQIQFDRGNGKEMTKHNNAAAKQADTGLILNRQGKLQHQCEVNTLTAFKDESSLFECKTYTDNGSDLDDIDIVIAEGECPGTIVINIMCLGEEFTEQNEGGLGDLPLQVPVITKMNHACPVTEVSAQHTNIMSDNALQSAIYSEECTSVKRNNVTNYAGKTSVFKSPPNKVKCRQRKETDIVILSRKSPAKWRTSQSNLCLTVGTAKVIDVNKTRDGLETTSFREADSSGIKITDRDTPDHLTLNYSHSKRNQEAHENTGTMKKFKGICKHTPARRYIAAGIGDYTRSSRDYDSKQKRSILDDVDEAIPRVIPKSGKQVKFGDEIVGSRLVQPSPEKCFSSGEVSPSKVEKSILKKSAPWPSDDTSVEPQVYYNSSYKDDGDSDDNDSGLADDDDYRAWECREIRYQSQAFQSYRSKSPERRSIFSESSNYYGGQQNEPPRYHVEARMYEAHRPTAYYQTQRTNTCLRPDHFAVSRTEREPNIRTEYSQGVRVYDDYYSICNQYIRRSPGYCSWIMPSEEYTKNSCFFAPACGTRTLNDSKQVIRSKKHSSSKQCRRDKKKKQYKKKGKNETDTEKCQKLLSSGQVRLASRGNFDVRRIKLEYLLHIGDFSMKYKTEPGSIESMTLTVYTETVGPSIDVRHMLQMQSNFINRPRYYLRNCNEMWLMHKFLHLGALQVLMNRDPYRDVLGEVHAQFVTAGMLIGINYLHQNGITHGNLYPWKILINDRGYPVLTGFLPLYDNDDPVTNELRERRRYIFCAPYAAPDRFLGDMHPSVDIFSIGCIAYEMITGRTPFYGGSEERTKENILSFSYRPVYEFDLFSFAGEMFIDSCLRKHSAHRFVPGRHLTNLYHEEWFSTLDLGRYENQTLDSPILDVVQLLHKGDTLDVEEKILDYSWGRVMDVMSPYTPTLVY